MPSAFQSHFDGAATPAVPVVIEEPQHAIIDFDRKIVSNLLHFFFGRFLESGIDQGGEGFYMLEVVDGCRLVGLVCQTVAFPEGGQFDGVDSGDEIHQFTLQPKLLGMTGCRVEDQIDGSIELVFRPFQGPLLIEVLAFFKPQLGLEDRHINGVVKVDFRKLRREWA